MQFTKLPFSTLGETNINLICKEIEIDVKKIENTLKLIRQWLKCESYLPADVDEILLKNFVLGCKCNVEKTKEKLEKYIVARTKMTYMYHDRAVKMDDFLLFPYHRFCYICPKQTSEGNRVLMIRMPLKDPTHFDYFKFVKYLCLVFDILLFHDTSAGYHFIYDVHWFSPQYLAKINLGALKFISEMIYNILPIRIRSLMVLNDNVTMQVMMKIAKAFMSKKLRERISSVKTEDLTNYHSKVCLPIEYGGTQGYFNDNADQILQLLRENSKWCDETERFILTGPVPEHKKNLYSFEDFSMDGSFRKLGFD